MAIGKTLTALAFLEPRFRSADSYELSQFGRILQQHGFKQSGQTTFSAIETFQIHLTSGTPAPQLIAVAAAVDAGLPNLSDMLACAWEAAEHFKSQYGQTQFNRRIAPSLFALLPQPAVSVTAPENFVRPAHPQTRKIMLGAARLCAAEISAARTWSEQDYLAFMLALSCVQLEMDQQYTSIIDAHPLAWNPKPGHSAADILWRTITITLGESAGNIIPLHLRPDYSFMELGINESVFRLFCTRLWDRFGLSEPLYLHRRITLASLFIHLANLWPLPGPKPLVKDIKPLHHRLSFDEEIEDLLGLPHMHSTTYDLQGACIVDDFTLRTLVETMLKAQ